MTLRRAKKLWYVLAVEPGQDNRIRREILRQAKIQGLEKEFGRIIVKHHIEERLRNGKWVPCRVKSYPGYVLVHMRYGNETFHVVNSLKRIGVFGFLNMKPQLGGKRYPKREKPQNTPPKAWEIEAHEDWKPTPVASVEVGFLMLDEMAVNRKKKELKRKGTVMAEPVGPKYAVDDEVTVTTGTFAGCVGKVKRVVPSQDGQTLTVEIVLMGKATKVGLSSNDVERKV